MSLVLERVIHNMSQITARVERGVTEGVCASA
jgi:hypothetical protein